MKHSTTDMTHNRDRWIFPTLALAMLLASLGTSIANIALPALATSFAAPFTSVQMVVIAYLATLTIGVLAAGRIGDHVGLTPALLGGLVLFTLASAACALATSLSALIISRAVQGVGAAFLLSLSMALMRQSADRNRIGRAMGLLGTVSAIGTALGPSLGGLLLPAFGWSSLFWLQVPLGLVALLAGLLVLPRERRKGRRPQATPLLSVLDAALVSSLLVNLLVAAVMMTTLVVGPFYLGLALGLSPAAVGAVMTVGPAMSILSGVPSGRLVDRFGSATMLMAGLFLLLSGCGFLALLPKGFGVVGYIVPMALLTSGYQLFQAANNTSVLADAPEAARGTLSGVLSLSRNLGLIGGASVMGAIFAVSAGTHDMAAASSAAVARGMHWTFLAAALAIALGIGVTLSARRSGRNVSTPHTDSSRATDG